MYKIPRYSDTSMIIDNTKEGETIENKVKRLVQNKEPINDASPIIFTEKSGGVNPAYNIRTDRWEIAVDAMDRLMKSKQAKKDDLMKTGESKKEDKKDDAKTVNVDFGVTDSTHGKAS